MSYKRVTYLYCDGAECKADRDVEPFTVAPYPGETITEQRDRARRQGWLVRKNGNDYCPRCRMSI